MHITIPATEAELGVLASSDNKPRDIRVSVGERANTLAEEADCFLSDVLGVAGNSCTTLTLNLRRSLGASEWQDLFVAFATLPRSIETITLEGLDPHRVSDVLFTRMLANLPEHITTLSLYDNNLDKRTAEALAQGFSQLPSGLGYLNLSRNGLTRNEEAFLVTVLDAIPATVQHLGFDDHYFERLPSEVLASCLLGNNACLYMAMRVTTFNSACIGMLMGAVIFAAATIAGCTLPVALLGAGIGTLIGSSATFFAAKQVVDSAKSIEMDASYSLG